MPERINRRDNIVDAAAHLFVQNGYDATSVRQIADVVGVTEAALYYHFKDGKRELMQAVLECNMPDLMSFDKNGDKKITEDELPDNMKRMLEFMDEDKDGSLSAGEISKARARFQQRQREGGGQGGPGGPGGGAPGGAGGRGPG